MASLLPTAHCPLSSSRLSLDNTEAELHSLFVRTRSLKEHIRRDDELCQQMQDFLQVCGRFKSLPLVLRQLFWGWLDLHGRVWGSSRFPFIFSPPASRRSFVFQRPFSAGLVLRNRRWTWSKHPKVFVREWAAVCHCSMFTITIAPRCSGPGSVCGARLTLSSQVVVLNRGLGVPVPPSILWTTGRSSTEVVKTPENLGCCSLTCVYWRHKPSFGMFSGESSRTR